MSTQALALRIEALFGRAMFFSASDAEISIEASVERRESARHWYVRIGVSNTDGDILGNRELRIFEDDCEAIIEPVSVIIALMMDPEGRSINLPENLSKSQLDAAEELLKEISSRPGTQETKAGADMAAPTEREERVEDVKTEKLHKEDQSLAWHTILSLDAVINLGLLPDVGFGISVSSTQIIGEFWPIEIRGTFFVENAAELDSSEGEVGFYGVLATIRVCPFTFKSLGLLLLCAGFDSGGIFVSETDKDFSVEKREFFVLGGDIYSRFILGIWDGIDLNLGLALIFLRPRTFRYIAADGRLDDLYEMGPFAGNLEIGIAVQF